MSTSIRQAATAARKDQIIRAAIALLAEGGYQATTFDAICKKAELSSKRLITYHFSGKDELFAAIADKIAGDGETYMRPALDAATGAREVLTALIRANVAFIADHPDEVRAVRQITLNGSDVWETHHLESLKRVAAFFADGQRTGAFRPFVPEVMAMTLRAAIDNVYTPLSAGIAPDVCANELIDLFDRATRPA
jgi:AcrR family transcriptional regulator